MDSFVVLHLYDLLLNSFDLCWRLSNKKDGRGYMVDWRRLLLERLHHRVCSLIGVNIWRIC